MTVRSYRCNNPGNLQKGAAWLGLLPRLQMTPEQQAEDRFAVFRSATYGFRALAITLLNYQRIHQIKTIEGIVERFAPASENDTEAYVAALSLAVGLPRDAEIDLTMRLFLTLMCKGIAIHEAGSWVFSDDDLSAGVSAALGLPPPQTPPMIA